MITRVYDGGLACGHCGKCPVADYDPKAGTVKIHDPVKPQNGSMTMSVEEYNALLAGGRPIPVPASV